MPAPMVLIYHLRTVMHSFCIYACCYYLHFVLFHQLATTTKYTESEGEAITVGRVVVVGVAVGVDITKVRGVARIWRALPPVVGRSVAHNRYILF